MICLQLKLNIHMYAYVGTHTHTQNCRYKVSLNKRTLQRSEQMLEHFRKAGVIATSVVGSAFLYRCQLGFVNP